tara:strand:+ start:497 stop:850 length:354 start_codon:yes stop_codon:yes gene_type:complete
MDKDKSYSRVFNKEDFVISITPITDVQSKWTGQVAVDITSSNKNPLNVKDYNHIFHLCKMLCSVIPLMEEDAEMVERLDEYVKIFDASKPPKDRLVVSDKNDNVIKLDWFSKIKGRA